MRAVRFGSVTVWCDGDVLEPRPWTLAQAAWAIDLAAHLEDGPVLELCAGVGHIGLVVAKATGRDLVQVDASPRACELAVRNAAENGIASDVRVGDVTRAVLPDERFAVVLADPPYVPSGTTDQHPGDPTQTIDGGSDGLEIARRCLTVAARHLTRSGVLVLQLRDLLQAADLALGSRALALESARDVDGHGCLALFRP